MNESKRRVRGPGRGVGALRLSGFLVPAVKRRVAWLHKVSTLESGLVCEAFKFDLIEMSE